MQNFDMANMIYLVLLVSVIGFTFFVQNRQSLGKTAQQALTWGLIFLGVIAAFGMWGDIRQTVRPIPQFGVAGQIELPRNPDGHFYITLTINTAPIHFVIDTGASQIVLTQSDAELAGFDIANLAYSGRAFTANGEVRTAPVRLDTIEIGPHIDQNLRAVVNQGEMDTSLLGMSYLQRFSSLQINGNTMVLLR